MTAPAGTMGLASLWPTWSKILPQWMPGSIHGKRKRARSKADPKRPIPADELFAYASLAAPLALPEFLLLILIPAFYADRLGLGAIAVGFALTAARLIDMVSEPVIGVLSDRAHTRFGIRRPWMVIGLIPVVIGAYFLIFPARSAGPIYLFVWASVVYLGWNAIRTPYRAWGAELAPDYDFRTDVAGMREMMGLLGFVAAIAIPVVFADNQVAPSWAPRTSLMMIAMFVSILALLPLATAICLARVEARDPEPVRRRYPTRAAFREFMANRPFGRFLIAATLTALAHGITASLFLLLVRHVLSRPDQGARYLALTFAAAALTIPVAAFLSRKKSKHRAWGWLLCLSAVGLMFTPVLGAGGTAIMVVICGAIGIGLGADLALGFAVLADVVDYDRLRSGERRAGAYFGLTGFAAKAAAAIAVALSFAWLAAIGFEPGAQAPAPEQILLFAIFFGGAPALCRFIAAIVIWDFRPGRYKHADIEKALRKRARRRIMRRKPQRPTPAQRRTARKKAARQKAAARKAARARATAKTKAPRKRSNAAAPSAKSAATRSARKTARQPKSGKAPKKTKS